MTEQCASETKPRNLWWRLRQRLRLPPWYRWPFYGIVYRTTMRVAHRFNWHYAPPSYPDGDTMLWCHWCGMRDVVKRRPRPGDPSPLSSIRFKRQTSYRSWSE